MAVLITRKLGDTTAEIRDVLRARTPTHRRLRDRLVGIAPLTVGVDLICAVTRLLDT